MKHNKKCMAMKKIHFIQLLTSYRSKPKQFKKLLECASKHEINAITEIIFNVLKGTLPCNKKKLIKKASYLRYIANKKNPLNKRKSYLIKKGNGILAPLLSLTVPALIRLFSK